jgi:hypothetical protein
VTASHHVRIERWRIAALSGKSTIDDEVGNPMENDAAVNGRSRTSGYWDHA